MERTSIGLAKKRKNMSKKLEKEFQFYLDRQEELLKICNGKYVVVKNETIIGVYDNEYDAVIKTAVDHPLGTFLVQLCTPGDEAYTVTFHSRVWFDKSED